MSLILTSSRLSENDGVARGQLGSEQPADYKNFFRSPIEIEADSEIAVQSVKIERVGNVAFNNNSYFCHYWGKDPAVADAEGNLRKYDELLGIGRNIKPNRGSYNYTALSKELNRSLDAAYGDPRIFSGSNVVSGQTNASGKVLGLKMAFVAQGSASGAAFEMSASLTKTNVFNLAAPGGTTGPSSRFSWVPGTGTVQSIIGTPPPSFNNAGAVGQLVGKPFGLNEGKFDVTTSGLTAFGTRRWVVGLSRPQIQYRAASASGKSNPIRPSNVQDLDFATFPQQKGDRDIVNEDEQGVTSGPWEVFDYAVMLTEDDEIVVLQRGFVPYTERVAAAQNAKGWSANEEVNYWNGSGATSGLTKRMTVAEWNASYDGIRFEGAGDEIKLYFKNKGKTTYDQILGSNLLDKKGFVFTPIGDTSYALYPTFDISLGSFIITQYQSNYNTDTPSYKFPTYTETPTVRKYTPGSDLFSNEAFFGPGVPGTAFNPVPGRSLIGNGVVSQIDSSQIKWDWQQYPTHDGGEGPSGAYEFVGLNAALGVDYKHLITMAEFDTEISDRDTITESQEFPNTNLKLGFPNRAIIFSNSTDGYVTGDGGLTNTFKSAAQLELVNKSCFIRVPNMTHKSYNGAQSSMSKILYQVPQFTNDGRQFGPLYFEPGEKAYVSLNNPESMLLNQMDVQFVEANERLLDTLTGSTQVVFHIRKRKS
mgnify:FL=1